MGQKTASSLMEETWLGREIKALGVGKERRGTRNENWVGMGCGKQSSRETSESLCGRIRFGFPIESQSRHFPAGHEGSVPTPELCSQQYPGKLGNDSNSSASFGSSQLVGNPLEEKPHLLCHLLCTTPDLTPEYRPLTSHRKETDWRSKRNT